MQFRTDAFPFCVKEDSTVGDGTLHPFAATLTKSAEWFWRVKKWSVTVEMTWNTFVFNDLQFSFVGAQATTERDIICFDGELRMYGLDEYTDGVSIFNAFVEWEAFFCATAGFPLVPNPSTPGDFITDGIRTFEDADYPQFLFRMRSAGDGVDDSDISTWNNGSATNSGLRINWDGYAVRSYSNTLAQIVGITFAPEEWWPYAPESDDSEPIYDTETGERIRANTVRD